VEIESLNRSSLPDCKGGYKEIITNASEVDNFDSVGEFVFYWLKIIIIKPSSNPIQSPKTTSKPTRPF